MTHLPCLPRVVQVGSGWLATCTCKRLDAFHTYRRQADACVAEHLKGKR